MIFLYGDLHTILESRNVKIFLSIDQNMFNVIMKISFFYLYNITNFLI